MDSIDLLNRLRNIVLIMLKKTSINTEGEYRIPDIKNVVECAKYTSEN